MRTHISICFCVLQTQNLLFVTAANTALKRLLVCFFDSRTGGILLTVKLISPPVHFSDNFRNAQSGYRAEKLGICFE